MELDPTRHQSSEASLPGTDDSRAALQANAAGSSVIAHNGGEAIGAGAVKVEGSNFGSINTGVKIEQHVEARPSTLTDRWIERLKNNWIVAVAVVVTVIVVGLSSLTESTGRLLGTLVGPGPEAARAELARMSYPFDATGFAKAAGDGDAVAVKLFLAAGIPVDEMTRDGETNALIEAARKDRSVVVDLLLSAHADQQKRSSERGTALSAAAGRGHARIVDVLLKQNPPQEIIGSAMWNAARAGHVEILRKLLDHGPVSPKAIVDALEAVSTSQLGQEKELVTAADLLLDRGADPNAKTRDSGWTLVNEAAYGPHPGVLQVLLKRGGKVDVRDVDGFSPLHWAAGVGRFEQAVLLHEHGADVNAMANDGTTPLGRAAYNNDKKMVDFLLEKGARVNVGASALGDARDIAIIDILLAKGANPNAIDTKGVTVLMRFAARGQKDGCARLIEKGARVNDRDRDGFTALMYAVMFGAPETTRSLLKFGARVNDKNAKGESPLQLARENLKGETLRQMEQLLIQSGGK